MEMPEIEKNKALYDYLYSKKSEIEAKAQRKYQWERSEYTKKSKVFIELPGVGVAKKADWHKMAEFHATECSIIVKVFMDYLKGFFEKVQSKN